MIVEKGAGLALLKAQDPIGDLEGELGKAMIARDLPPGAARLCEPRHLAEMRPVVEPVAIITERARELCLVDRRQLRSRRGAERQQHLAWKIVLESVRRQCGIAVGMHASVHIDARPQRSRK